MRMNNKSARLTINHWLAQSGHVTLSGALSFEQFATELRKIRAPLMQQAPFSDRAEAVAYIRDVARSVSA